MAGANVDPLKYHEPVARRGNAGDELLTVKLRYKAPDRDESRLLSVALAKGTREMTANTGFASAVAEVGLLLRRSPHAARASYEAAIARARRFRGEDADGYRAEFIKLAELAASLQQLSR
jgi:Ca-activated chloride channel family protein